MRRPSGCAGAPCARKHFLIALSGYGRAEDRERSRSAGFDLHLVKPIDAAQLASALANVPG